MFFFIHENCTQDKRNTLISISVTEDNICAYQSTVCINQTPLICQLFRVYIQVISGFFFIKCGSMIILHELYSTMPHQDNPRLFWVIHVPFCVNIFFNYNGEGGNVSLVSQDNYLNSYFNFHIYFSQCLHFSSFPRFFSFLMPCSLSPPSVLFSSVHSSFLFSRTFAISRSQSLKSRHQTLHSVVSYPYSLQ